MKTCYEMLIELKNRYYVYIENKSFKKFMLFFEGYEKCITELFGGEEFHITKSLSFYKFVEHYFQVKKPNHNWKEILLFESHTDENAFDVFYKILDLYLQENPIVMQEEKERQKKYHVFQLDKNLQQVSPNNHYFTSARVSEWLDMDSNTDNCFPEDKLDKDNS